MKYILKEDLGKIMKGSVEEFSEKIEQLATEAHGKQVQLVATFNDAPCYGVSEGELYKIEWYGVENTKVKLFPASMKLIEEGPELNKYLGKMMVDAVRNMIDNADATRQIIPNLNYLVGAIAPEGVYTPYDVYRMFESDVFGQPWASMYVESRELIRKSVWGSLSDIEESSKFQRFAHMSEARLVENKNELIDSFDRIKNIASEVVKSCESLCLSAKKDSAMRESILSEANSLNGLIPSAIVMIENVRDLAKLHDRCASRMQDMSVTSAYLKSQPAVGV